MRHRLSKSRFVTGLQCHKYLWWKVHEPDASELKVDPETQFRFDQGTRVGELAQSYVPGGVLIDLPYYQIREKVEATRDALRSDPPAIYEASFLADGVFVAVDILEKVNGGFRIIEVKSSTSVKPYNIPDAAVQAHVLCQAGLSVVGAEIMHLNTECRYPNLDDLFIRADVTTEVEGVLGTVPGEIQAQLRMLSGPLPTVPVGAHCSDPFGCDFWDRCWPELPEHHIRTLSGVGEKKEADFREWGIKTLADIPNDHRLNAVQKRQLRAVREDRLVVEGDLADALDSLRFPIAYLDFETVAPAVPVWDGCGPYGMVPVQFSVHVEAEDGRVTHHEWIAAGPEDPRTALAQDLVEVLEGSASMVAYSAGFESGCLKDLARAVPSLSDALLHIVERLEDLLPIVRNHVYHPDFHGSFSLKKVAPALLGEDAYQDLEIAEGQLASVELHRLMFEKDDMDPQEWEALRRDLLAYCKEDTLLLVKLRRRLGEVV